MKRNIFALLRTFVFAAFVPALALSLAACEPENGGGTGTGGEEDGTEDVTSEIAVTGLVDKFGCTYADISGYANLNLLPAGSGNPVIGVEVVEAKAESNDNAVQSTSGSLTGNIFTASFSDLSPATEYKYRSFVTYGGITYYGNKYNTFTTKEVVNVTSTGEASDIKYFSAVLSASVQTEGVDARDNVYVGLSWSATKDAISADGNFESRKTSVQNMEDGVFTVSLNDLSEGTTYYFASFTLVGGVYAFSSVKEFTTDVIRLETGAVDLGLSVKWAGCNVGANSPEEYGYYFAWGETEEKTDYSWPTYKWREWSQWHNGYILAKYCTSSSYGWVDNKTTLDLEDDVAHVQWGGSWRMPTKDEQDELRTKCDWEWTTMNGVEGYLVTGPNGNSIFLPAAGYRNGTDVRLPGSYGSYWSGTLDENDSYDAYIFSFWRSDNPGWGNYDRYFGLTVRPVTE
ncbi:MAG: hypothetical protein E7091_09900 [Bacteroidales bacterium]|nr:hypothetical protein [Bacteroidales bacterium]